jgi:hypothetical protein
MITNLLSPGKRLWTVLLDNLKVVRSGPVRSGRSRTIIWGVTHFGSFVEGMTLDGFLEQASDILLKSERVYAYANTIVLEDRDQQEAVLRLLATGAKAESDAPSILTNLFGVGVRGENGKKESLTPGKLVSAVLADSDLQKRLPRIRYYARRPIFDDAFHLCKPGWNAEEGILVHGPEIEPALPSPAMATADKAMDCLPPYIRALLEGFCWADEADLTNAVGLLLTGFLINHFIDDPHPIGIIDGNQKGVGKTLLCQVLGRILDDREPARLPLIRDEELEKKLCAQLRDSRSSIFFFDNVRDRIESAVIEQNALSPVLSFRILGQSGTFSRPNGYLWLVTSNMTSGTEDFINRGLPIRLRHEGDPRTRNFSHNPLEYATRHRIDILGELAGMVIHWNQAARPKGKAKHRCQRWAEIIGGILEANGLHEFLGNVSEVEEVMDEGLAALSTLAEYVLASGRTGYFVDGCGQGSREVGKTPKDWAALFTDAKLFEDKLAGMSSGQGRITWVGQFLSGKVDRPVALQVGGDVTTARLRVRHGGANRRYYYFEIASSAVDGKEQVAGSNSDTAGVTVKVSDVKALEAIQRLHNPARAEVPRSSRRRNETVPVMLATSPVIKAEEARGNDLDWGV